MSVQAALEKILVGDAFLKQKLGHDYWKTVNPETLDMYSTTADIVAQATGRPFGEMMREWGVSRNEQQDLGFRSNVAEDITHKDLTTGWKFLLKVKGRWT